MNHPSSNLQISGYVPFFNNAATVVAAAESLRMQEPPLGEVFAVDDGSSDDSADLLKAARVRIIRQPANLGRGAARARAMEEAKHPLVLCCDATNTLPVDFARKAQVWFQDPAVAGVFGLIKDPAPQGAVARWRARHLFKSDKCREVNHQASLITFGTMLKARAVADVGGFDRNLVHSEDSDLGDRLLTAGYKVISDPTLNIYSNINNTVLQALERYWRWYVGKEEQFGPLAYLHSIWFALRSMAWEDLRARDPIAALISLALPHYQFWRFLNRR